MLIRILEANGKLQQGFPFINLDTDKNLAQHSKYPQSNSTCYCNGNLLPSNFLQVCREMERDGEVHFFIERPILQPYKGNECIAEATPVEMYIIAYERGEPFFGLSLYFFHMTETVQKQISSALF